MPLINIVAYRKDGFFGIPIIGETSSFAIKFDTGASKTVISIETITGELQNSQMKILKDYALSKNIYPSSFKSATGHYFDAFPAYLKNIAIGNCLFEKFYYYAIFDKLVDDRKVALLGDDFVDCCAFSKAPHGDIIISEFDFERYGDHQKTLSLDEISSLI